MPRAAFQQLFNSTRDHIVTIYMSEYAIIKCLNLIGQCEGLNQLEPLSIESTPRVDIHLQQQRCFTLKKC